MTNQCNLLILVIDDNPEIQNDFMKILTKDISDTSDLDALEQRIFGEIKTDKNELPQFIINYASQGLEGIECVENALRDNIRYALAFVDIRMPPGLDGIETIKRIWALDPDIQIVINRIAK